MRIKLKHAAALVAVAVAVVSGGCQPASHRSAEVPDTSAAATPDGAAPQLSDDLPNAPWRAFSERPADRASGDAGYVLIRGARLLLGDGREIKRGHVLLASGRILAVGEGDGQASAGVRVIDARGKTVTPGLIDTHSHLGVYPTPHVAAHEDGNEMSSPLTPGVRAVDAFWPQDPGIQRAVAGGVTSIQALPGSGNLIGGQGVTLKLRRATRSRDMQFRGAPTGLKMACGENPKRVYGERKSKPMTRMGNLAVQRDAFLNARRLITEWDKWREAEAKRRKQLATEKSKFEEQRKRRAQLQQDCRAGRHAKSQCRRWREQWQAQPIKEPSNSSAALPPKRDLDLETLAGAIEGQVLVHIHCYRSDDMANMMKLADEMGFQIRSFHHALEAYKIRDTLAQRNISVSTWADWWGFKMEAYDGIPQNLSLVADAGGMAIVHSDSREGIRRLNQEAAKGLAAGIHAGIPLTEAQAISWITLNPAWALGIDDFVGSLAVGKDADVVIWDRNPFSVYASAERVFVDGIEVFDKAKPGKPWSDFEAAP